MKHREYESRSSSEGPKAYYVVRRKLKGLLEEHKNAKFVVTGHSLGGVLAILFTSVLVLHEEMKVMQRLLGVYTFGQPRVGDRQLARYMDTHLGSPIPKYFRVVYCNDLLPRLPYDYENFMFKHFGVCLHYDSCYIEHRLEDEPSNNYFGMKYLVPEYLNAVWELIRSLAMGYTHGVSRGVALHFRTSDRTSVSWYLGTFPYRLHQFHEPGNGALRSDV